MRTIYTSALVFALAFTPSLVLKAAPAAQEKSAQKGEEPQKPPREVGKPQTKEEYDAYVAITQAADAQQRAGLCEQYLQDFPDSGLTPYVHQIAATTYQQLNNFDKLAEHGEETLKELPNSPVILTILANGYAERGKPDLALERAEQALTTINALEPPEQMDPAQFAMEKNNLLATVYSSRGVAYLAKATEARAQRAAEQSTSSSDPTSPSEAGKKEEPDPNLEAAITDLKKALELNVRDDYSYFRLGIIYTLKNDAENAIDAYAKAVAVGGAVSSMARENLEKVYKLTHQNSLEGLEERLNHAREALSGSGQPGGDPGAGASSQPPTR